MLEILQLSSFLVIGFGLLWLAMLLFGLSRKQRASATMWKADLNAFKARTDLLLEQTRETRQESDHAWNNYRKFELVKKEMETKDICSFYLAPHDRLPLPPFRPGQFLTFKLDVPGQKKNVIRCYSLSDSAYNRDMYRVTIKRLDPPRDKPEIAPGVSSNYFHDALQELDILDIKAPSGQFYFDLSKPRPSVLIAGGIGLTPVLSMVSSMVDTDYQQETWLFYGLRNKTEHAMQQHLKNLDAAYDWLHMNVCYSDPGDDDVKGEDYDYGARVSVELFQKLLPSNNYDFYMCGPPPMMSSLVGDLEAWGVPEDRIHLEAFGPASVKKVSHVSQDKNPEGQQSTFDVSFAKSGKKLIWDGDSDTLLDFAEENDIDIDFGCRTGNCGSCLTAVKSGEVELINDDVGADIEKGSCLLCVSRPKSNLVLDG